jgi:hypothetical protein
MALTDSALDWLGLGMGGAGTGFGIYDIVKAHQDAAKRDFAIKHWTMQHPYGSYMPQLSDQVRAAMIRPSAANLATAGLDPSGGAFTQGVTDSMAKMYSDLFGQSEAQRMSDYQAFITGQGGPPQSSGSVAGLPQALQYMQIARALRQPQQAGPTGAADTRNLPNMDLYTPGSPLGSDFQTNWPQGDVSGGTFPGQYQSFYPDYATERY